MIGILALVLLVSALILTFFGVRSRRMNTSAEDVMERMGRFATREDFLSVSDGTGKKEPSKVAQSLEQMVKGRTMADRITSVMVRADVRLTIGEFLLIRCACAGGGFLLGFIILARFAPALGVLMGIATGLIGYAAPMFYLSFKAKKREKKFVSQLGDTITLMANSLRAGYSLLQTMDLVSRETKDPISVEFKRVVHEIGLGITNQDAMTNLLRRVPSDDLDLLVSAINIQHEVGGNLAQILTIIGHTIRERVRIKGEIKVLTAQVQLSGIVITVMPILLAGVIFLMNPGYLTPMFHWPYICMPIASVIMITVGYMIMRKITAIEV
jgi:tight adherence protein B